MNIDNKESFLIMGYTCFKKINNNIPSVTGAKKPVVCGEFMNSNIFREYDIRGII